MIDKVRNQQCQLFPDIFPIAWQENASPHPEWDPSVEHAWEYLESRGSIFKLEHPFLVGAKYKRKRTDDGQDEANAKAPAQPA
eukprot:4349916-Pyramimonas_sp.AAC.1